MSKKKLVINAAVCDATRTHEETLAGYESITINSAMLLTTPETRKLLHNYNVMMNCNNVLEIDSDVEIIMQNGHYTISASDAAGKKAFLFLNGSLTIEPGAEKALSRFVGMHVNGSVTYPDSLAPYLGSLKVNGSVNSYPDDAILLSNTFIVDKTFIKRCKNVKYFARKRVVIIDNALDIAGMVNKGAMFLTKTAIISESLVDAALPLFQETTEIITVPDGCSFINDSVKLNKSLLIKNGTKLYINGDLAIDSEARDLLEKIEYLYVNGGVSLPESLEEIFSRINAQYNELVLVRGKCIEDKIRITIDRRMLEQNPEGITVKDCVNVIIAEDVPPELILERVEFYDCVNISCFPEQRSAVEQVSDDVVNIDDSGKGLKGMLSNLIPSLGENLEDVKMVNASTYTL